MAIPQPIPAGQPGSAPHSTIEPVVGIFGPGFRGRRSAVSLPWGLRPLGSAQYGIETLEDGRICHWIRHGILRGVTPRMLAWWFAHIDGLVRVGRQQIHRYRLWHPYDHIHHSYVRRLPDGSVGPGAAMRLTEVLGGNPRYLVDVVTEIEKLDEEGFVHCPLVHGVRGLVRMEYAFRPVDGGTLYENNLVVGTSHRLWRVLEPVVRRLAFPDGKGEAWIRHNVEEVGMLEHFLPDLYREETGLDG